MEDEDGVRKLARLVMEASGSAVLEFSNGREGLALCEAHEGRVDLLVTDVVMPELGGRGPAEGALKLGPGMKVMLYPGTTRMLCSRKASRGEVCLRPPVSRRECATRWTAMRGPPDNGNRDLFRGRARERTTEERHPPPR